MKFPKYTFQARLCPVLILLAPIGLTIAAWFPEKFVGWGLLTGALSSSALTMLFSQVGRDAGKRREEWLFKEWGGAPTTRLLRYSTSTLNPVLLERYRKKLRVLIPDVPLPSMEDEERDRSSADHSYETCVSVLRELTRDEGKFPLVFSENVSYGFRRNLYGLKGSGIVICLIGAVACIVSAVGNWWFHEIMSPVAICAALATIALGVIWWLHITAPWVRIAADGYATQLFAACEHLDLAEDNQSKSESHSRA